MKKIGDVTSTATQAGEFTNGNVAAGIAPTILEGEWFNALQREVLNVLLKANIKQDPNIDDQLTQAIIKLAGTAFGVKIKQTLGDSTTDVVSQNTVTEEVNKKLDKASVLQTTGNATDKVISQKACDDNYARKDSQEPFTAGQINIKSNGDYASLILTKSGGQHLVFETSPNDAYFVYRDAQNNNKAVVTIPSAKNGTLALTSDVENSLKMWHENDKWWFKDERKGLIFQGGKFVGKNDTLTETVPLNVNCPHSLLSVAVTVINLGQGYATTVNPHVYILTNDSFGLAHTGLEREVYWQAIGY